MAKHLRNQQGFTLIELLVVVSIIALLISILLPAVGQTRRQARISLCTSNMKQHGVGVGNYASQNNDTLPHAPLSTGRFPQEGPRGSTAWTFALFLASAVALSAAPGLPVWLRPLPLHTEADRSATVASLIARPKMTLAEHERRLEHHHDDRRPHPLGEFLD